MKKISLLAILVHTFSVVNAQVIDYSTVKMNMDMNFSQDVNIKKPSANSLCNFKFDERGFYSAQDESKDYVIYSRPNKSAADLKSTVLSAISSLFISPKDVVTNLGDNIIQLERYATKVYYTETGKDLYPTDVYYSLIIQFKDGKIRYNAPSIKQLVLTDVPMVGTLKLDMSKPIATLVKKSHDRYMVADVVNKTISEINKKIITADEW